MGIDGNSGEDDGNDDSITRSQSNSTKINYQDSVHQGDQVGQKVDTQTINDPDAIARIALDSYKQAIKDINDEKRKKSTPYPPVTHPRNMSQTSSQPNAGLYPPIKYPEKYPNHIPAGGALIDLDHPLSDLTVYLVWMITGIVGGHRIILGDWMMGVLYFCTAGLFCIGWLIDLTKLSTMITTARYEQRLLKRES